MKKLFTRLTSLLLTVTTLVFSLTGCFGGGKDSAEGAKLPYQSHYLINECKPKESSHYEEYVYTAASAKPMYMGGNPYYGGFLLKPGGFVEMKNQSYAVFDVSAYAGKTLSFVMGSASYDGFEDNNYYALISVQLDGVQVVDELIKAHDLPKRYTLDLTGKRELKFLVKEGVNHVYVAELTVWNGEPTVTGHTPDTSKNKVQLIKDLLPYMWKYSRGGDTDIIYTEDKPSADLEKFGAIWTNLDDFDRREGIKQEQVLIGGKLYSEVFTSWVTEQIVGTMINSYHFNAEKQYEYLSFSLGTRNVENAREGSSWVTVYADGERVFEELVFSDALPKTYIVNIKNAAMIEFEFCFSEGGSHHVAVFDAFLGKTLADVSASAPTDTNALPAVCKLISNIYPYSVSSGEAEPVYNGSSQHKTFTMTGRRYSEGIILYSKSSWLYGNSGAHACFNLGGAFKYLTFKAGLLDKTYSVADDRLEVYLDGELVKEIDLHAMDLPHTYTIDLNYCQDLKIKLVGRGGMIRPAYGVADMVVYKDEIVENDLFVEEIPEYPDEMPLIENIKPYMYYVSSNNVEDKSEILYDGSTKRHFFEINGEKKYAGVVLQTSVHLDILGVGSGEDVGGMYAALIAIPFQGYFLALLAADTRYENSFAAFDLRRQFKSVTFTVACANPDWYIAGMEHETKFMLGSNDDDRIMETITLSRDMEPTRYTVNVENTEQLIFFLECGDSTSAPYAIYDIVVNK